MFSLDRNRLTREWFHPCTTGGGLAADKFEETLELGHQLGFPWSLGVGINFSFTAPNILLDDVKINPLSAGFDPLGHVITRTCVPACRSVPTLATVRASKKRRRFRSTSLVLTATLRSPTRTAP